MDKASATFFPRASRLAFYTCLGHLSRQLWKSYSLLTDRGFVGYQHSVTVDDETAGHQHEAWTSDLCSFE